MKLVAFLRKARQMVLDTPGAVTAQPILASERALEELEDLVTRPKSDDDRARLQSKGRVHLGSGFISAAVRCRYLESRFDKRHLQTTSGILLNEHGIGIVELEKKLIENGVIREALEGGLLYLFAGWYIEHLGMESLFAWLVSVLKGALFLLTRLTQEHPAGLAEQRSIDETLLERTVDSYAHQISVLDDEDVSIRDHVHRAPSRRSKRGLQKRGAATTYWPFATASASSVREGMHRGSQRSEQVDFEHPQPQLDTTFAALGGHDLPKPTSAEHSTQNAPGRENEINHAPTPTLPGCDTLSLPQDGRSVVEATPVSSPKSLSPGSSKHSDAFDPSGECGGSASEVGSTDDRYEVSKTSVKQTTDTLSVTETQAHGNSACTLIDPVNDAYYVQKAVPAWASSLWSLLAKDEEGFNAFSPDDALVQSVQAAHDASTVFLARCKTVQQRRSGVL